MPDSRSLALVVGCGDIAMATARLIGKRHSLFLIDVSAERLNAAIADLKATGFRADGKVCDITSRESVAALAEHLGSLAGLGVLAHVAALAPSCNDWRKLVEVNIVGPHLIAQAIGPLIEAGGAAVFVGSVAAYAMELTPALKSVLVDPLSPAFLEKLEAASPRPMDPSLGYVFTKAALVAWCEKLAVEWGPRAVRVVSVSPGLILSSMGARERAHNPRTKAFVEQTPLRREGTVAEAAAAIDFALSPAASFLNGVDLLVDGGLRAANRVAASNITLTSQSA